MRIGPALVLPALLAACTAAELTQIETTASADFAAACQDWQAVKAIAGEAGALLPPPFDEAAAVTEGFVGDACTNQAFIEAAGAQEVTWINQSIANLKSVVAQATTPTAPSSHTASLRR
ncbi:MAG TPA: hypothetical protein VKS60_03125 [Stellaceae bacterium]|nr:hypothetical protein [Stellaceae bacterium]